MAILASPSAWPAKRPKKEHYDSLEEQYGKFCLGNELIVVPSVGESINTRTITLLTKDVKTRKLIGVSRKVIEEYLKIFSIRV